MRVAISPIRANRVSYDSSYWAFSFKKKSNRPRLWFCSDHIQRDEPCRDPLHRKNPLCVKPRPTHPATDGAVRSAAVTSTTSWPAPSNKTTTRTALRHERTRWTRHESLTRCRLGNGARSEGSLQAKIPSDCFPRVLLHKTRSNARAGSGLRFFTRHLIRVNSLRAPSLTRTVGSKPETMRVYVGINN